MTQPPRAVLTSVTPTLSDLAVHALAVHRMLTLEQIRELLTPHAVATTNWSTRLNRLQRRDLVRALPGRGARHRKVWCCTRAGLRVALSDPDQVRRYEVPESAGILQAHTLALNEVGLAFVRAARAAGDDCDYLSWEHEVAHSLGSGKAHRHTLIADGVLTYGQLSPDRRTETVLRRFVELDRATEPVARLAEKIRRYAAYHRWQPTNPDAHGLAPGQAAWRARYSHWPPLLVVIGANPAKSPEAIERRIDSLLELCRSDPLIRAEAIPVLIASFAAVTEAGPWAPIWWRVDAPDQPVDVAGRPLTAAAS